MFTVVALACTGCSSHGGAADTPGTGAPGLAQPAGRDAGRADSTNERDDTSAADRVAALRASFAARARGYVDALGVVDPSAPRSAPAATPRAPTAADQLAELRAQLSHETATALDAATSSEARIAVLRAELESTLETIHAYERAFGIPPQRSTTEWNALSDADLATLRVRTRASLAALERESHRYGDSERPAPLEHRQRELTRWSESLESEAVARAQGRAPTVGQIRPDISLAEARSHPTIAAAEAGDQMFAGKLRVQIALRSHWAPDDAGLANLARTSVSPGAGAARADSVFARVKAQQAARPPPAGAPRSAGPPDARALDIAEDVRVATWDELDAIRSRDPLAIGRALARQRTGMTWLKAAYGDDGVVLTRLSTHSSESLLVLRAEYRDWYRKLASEDAASPDTLQHHMEASDARATIAEIDDELIRRYQVSRDAPRALDPEDLAAGKIAPERVATLSALDRHRAGALAHEEAVQLELAANRARTVPDTRLAQAEEDAAMRSLEAEADALRGAWNALDEQARRILIGERGPEAAAHARRVTEARAKVADASVRVAADLDRFPQRAAPAVREARAKLAPLRARGATTARSSVLAALVDVEQLAAVPPAGASQPPEIAFFRDPGSHDPYRPEPPPDPARPGPRPSSGGAGGPEIEYVAPASPAGARVPPESYGELFPEGESWTHSQQGAVEPRRAPGGIVIDAVLPDPLAHRIERVTIDPGTGAIRVRIAGQWDRFAPAVDAATARAAWAFVRDGRVPAADVRPLALPEVAWLAPLYSGVPLYQLTASEQRALRDDLRILTSVNLNPALVATAIGVDLMVADLVIFDLLPASELTVEGDSQRFGIDAGPLWHAFWADRERQRTDPELGQQPFQKSLLVIKQSSATLTGNVLAASVAIEPSVFTMPLEGSRADPRTMAATTSWLTAHALELRAHVPALERLARFAATTALFKTIERHHIPNDLDVLVGVVARSVPTPRVFCRSTDATRCDRNRFVQHTEHQDSH